MIRTKSVIVGEMMSCEEREILYLVSYDLYHKKIYARKIYI